MFVFFLWHFVLHTFYSMFMSFKCQPSMSPKSPSLFPVYPSIITSLRNNTPPEGYYTFLSFCEYCKTVFSRRRVWSERIPPAVIIISPEYVIFSFSRNCFLLYLRKKYLFNCHCFIRHKIHWLTLTHPTGNPFVINQ